MEQDGRTRIFYDSDTRQVLTLHQIFPPCEGSHSHASLREVEARAVMARVDVWGISHIRMEPRDFGKTLADQYIMEVVRHGMQAGSFVVDMMGIPKEQHNRRMEKIAHVSERLLETQGLTIVIRDFTEANEAEDP